MISEELILDASQAEETIAQIDQQLQQTAELFKVSLADALDILSQPIVPVVEADVEPARSEIDALAAEPVPIVVDAQTADAEQQVLALGDVPVDVPITGDTGPALTSIDDLRQLADSLPIDIPVEADTTNAQAAVADLGSESGGAAGHVGELDGSLAALNVTAGITEGSARELVSVFGEMGGEGAGKAAAGIGVLAASTAGFFEEGLNAVSAGQRFNFILGDMADEAEHIDLNGLDTSIGDLGIRFGSTGADMENVTAKLVQFSVNSGASKEEAIQFAQQIETLSARAIALNPQLGSLADVTDSLGLKIGRGGRFAANYGLDLNGAEIATRALADTGKESAADLTFVEKAMAGAALASEKYGNTLGTTVAEGEQNAAIQAESLKAQFKEAIEQIGVPVVAPVFDILREALPIGVEVAGLLGELTKDVLPAVEVGLELIGPPLQLVATVLGLIPSPVLAAAAGFVIFATALTATAEAIGLSEAALIAIAPEIGLIAAALGIAAGVVSYFSSSQNDAVKAADDLTTALNDQTGAAKENVDALEAKRLADNDSTHSAHEAGVSFDLMNQAIQSGTDDFGGYIRIVDSAHDSLRTNATALQDVRQNLVDAGAGGTEFGQSLLDLIDNTDLSGEQLVTYLQTIERLHNEYVASANKAKTEQQSTSEIGDEAEAAAAKEEKFRAALQDVADVHPELVEGINQVTGAVGDEGAALENLTLSLNKANLSSEQLDTVAQALGVTSDQLKTFMENVTNQLDDFVKTAVEKLPNVSTAIDDALDPKAHQDKPIIIDPVKLQKEIDDAIAQIDQFNADIQFLTNSGLDNLAQIAAQRGPEFTHAIVEAVNSGDNVGEALDAKFEELNSKTRDEAGNLRSAGAGIAVATGDIADDATTAFGEHFQLAPPTEEQLNQARLLAELANVPLSEALRTIAGDAAVAYEQAIGVIPATTSKVLGDTSLEIDGWAHGIGSSAQTTGAAGEGGFAEGIAPVLATAQTLFGNVVDAINAAKIPLRTAARLAGEDVGMNFDEGIAQGIDTYISDIEAAARRAVDRAEAAARAASGTHSPSRLFADVGRDLIAGLALGMSDVTAVERASRLAIGASSWTPSGTRGASGGGGVPGDDRSGGGAWRDLIVQVAIPASVGSDSFAARRAGMEFGAGIADSLALRNIEVDARVGG